MKNRYEYDVERLQRYLPQLRGCAGLSAEAFGKKVGMKKQAINFIEKHPEKALTKMQYICFRAVFDDEYLKNTENINLRDCYDLVFSDPKFYEENKARIEYALYQAVEDTKIQKRKNRAEAKKANSHKTGVVGAVTGAITGASATLAGTTAATIGIGGIAAATFPLLFPVGAVITGMALASSKSKKKSDPGVTRESSKINYTEWMRVAFESVIEESNAEEE